jgi:hypothetical protein
MGEEKPNVARMEPAEYIEARIAQIPDEAKQVLGLEDPANKAQISHLFSVEYIRFRHGLLENTCRQLMRRYTAAMKALEGEVGSKKAAELFSEALKAVPEDLTEIPQL